MFNYVQEFRERSCSRSPLLPRGGIDVVGEFLEVEQFSLTPMGIHMFKTESLQIEGLLKNNYNIE